MSQTRHLRSFSAYPAPRCCALLLFLGVLWCACLATRNKGFAQVGSAIRGAINQANSVYPVRLGYVTIWLVPGHGVSLHSGARSFAYASRDGLSSGALPLTLKAGLCLLEETPVLLSAARASRFAVYGASMHRPQHSSHANAESHVRPWPEWLICVVAMIQRQRQNR